MYSFNPIADIPVDHSGFIFIAVAALVVIVFMMIEDGLVGVIMGLGLTVIPVAIAYGVSFHWTDQSAKTHPNIKVTGKFVQFVAESYNETRSSGKTSNTVTVRQNYVVYDVDGSRVMLPANVGETYPELVILYKN